ncbi:unnamed protein product, partial [Dovyalis caffra]
SYNGDHKACLPLMQPLEALRWKLPSLMLTLVLENQKQTVVDKQNTTITTKLDQVTNMAFDSDQHP